MSKHKDRGPGVRFPPPIVPVISILTGVGLQYVYSLLISFPFLTLLGAVFLFSAALLILLSVITFYQNKTSILPHRPDSALITSGPYKITRNPIYLAFILTQVGIALVNQNGWILMFTPVSIVILNEKVIKKEEAYLTNIFGTKYQRYLLQVRRWL